MSFISATTLITLFLTQSVLWLFLAYISSHLVVNLVTYYLFIKPASKTPTHITQKYLNYAKHTSLQNVVAGIANKADALIIFTRLGSVELALYSVATVIPEQVWASFKSLAALLIPKYAKVSDPNILIKTLPVRSLQLLTLLILVTTAYILISPFLIPFLFPNYPEAVLYTQVAALAFPAYLSLLPQSILKVKLDNSALHKINLSNSLMQVTLVFLGITFYGVLGAIIATVVRKYILLFCLYFFVNESK